LLPQLQSELLRNRFGDYIFVHHGADLSTHDPNLWVVVMLPDPDVNGGPGPDTPVQIGMNDHSVQTLTFSELAMALKEQNEYRIELALPPLPDLATVTHACPALGPAGDDNAAGPVD
jgi:hypothetical protein